ncbi:membrane protein insertase YidC [Deinococcus peraridilitoris]|uniref:Membrane protein insertase, YidC/Oxa1 family, C-terminal domain protein n=1 Tax=Deinococcus peraridilitoris (strain DSM 19664 / LMG 22246 / CIP 109416 / KR-200) TaxID=937777 RepID=L0A4E8_DEIPD|nr:membrane protein insertase YidC [Deinococcus peraridilitoris]AFZ68052.1 membrane protein insertase, YidC/Oxa1 family, C-terminal domain protein [Deinococcus peraridilitoris DSM 19664]
MQNQNDSTSSRPSTSPARSRAAFLLPLLALLGLGSASAAVTARWIEADFNGDGRKDLIATSNLADVVFNPEGEVIGWYPKVAPGSNLITEQNGAYGFNKLKNTISLVRERKAFEVVLPGNTAERQARPFTTQTDLPNNRLTAKFQYTQGSATVSKTIALNPRQFTMIANIDVDGAENYTVNFAGLSRNNNPDVKAVAQGSTDIQTSGTVNNIQYAALQEEPGTFNSQAVTALIVRPIEGTQASVNLQGGQNANLALQFSGPAQLAVYGGKNELIRLSQTGFLNLPGIFDPNLFGKLSLGVASLMEWLYGFLKSWFLVIVAITILIRLLIWPLMQSQARYTARLQFIQPEIKKLNEQYKDDPQKRAEATMLLYREHNVNPIGCLPMFIQFPFLIVLWNTIRNFEFDSGLLWLPDLSIPDPFYILAVLYVLANLLSLYVMTRKTPEMFKQQSFIYLIFAYFAITFPAGVTLYWILSTLFTVLQQVLINRQMEAAMAARNVQRVEVPVSPNLSKSVKPAKTAPALPKSKRQKE